MNLLDGFLEGLRDILGFFKNLALCCFCNRWVSKFIGWLVLPTIIVLVVSWHGWEILTLSLTWALNHRLTSLWPAISEPVQALTATSHFTFHPPIPTAEVRVIREVLGQFELALLAKDANLAQALALDFQKATSDVAKLQELNQELIPDIEIASNTQISTLQALIEEIEADPQDDRPSWKFWTPSPGKIAEARQDRLLHILKVALYTRSAERERITDALQTFNKDALTGKRTEFRGSICKINKNLGRNVDVGKDMEHIKAMARLMCLASERSDPRWKQVIRRIDKVSSVRSRCYDLILQDDASLSLLPCSPFIPISSRFSHSFTNQGQSLMRVEPRFS